MLYAIPLQQEKSEGRRYSRDKIQKLFEDFDKYPTAKELDYVIRRFDKDMDGEITFADVYM